MLVHNVWIYEHEGFWYWEITKPDGRKLHSKGFESKELCEADAKKQG